MNELLGHPVYATADVLLVVANTCPNSIQKQIKSMDVDKNLG